MDINHDFGRAKPLAPTNGSTAAVSGRACEAAIHEELLASPDCPRELLVAALQESRRRFDSLVSHLSGTFFRCDLTPPYDLEFGEPGGVSLSGYPLSSITSDVFAMLVHPEDLARYRQSVEQAVRDGTRFDVTYRLRHVSGEFRRVRSRGGAIYDERGKPRFIEGFVTDVTEKFELELAAETARRDAQALSAKLSHVFDSTLDCVMCFDRDWYLTYANGQASEEIGRNGYKDWSGSLDSLEPVKESFFWEVLQRTMKEREPTRAQGYLAEMDVWLDVYAAPDQADGITVFFRNISDYKRLQQELVEQAACLRSTLDSIPDMVWSASPDGYGDYYNRSWNEFIGLTQDECRASDRRPMLHWIHPDDRKAAAARWARDTESGRPFQFEMRLRHHSGEYRWVLARAWPQRDEDGRIVKWYGSATDIHERVTADHKLRENEILTGSILDATPDYVMIIDLEGTVTMLNTPALREEGLLDTGVVIGKRWADFWPKEGRNAVRRAIRKASVGEVVRFDGPCFTSKGDRTWRDNIVSPIRDDDGKIRRLLCITRDITELKATEERLRIASEQDFLTSLPNRRAFKRHLTRTIARARERKHSVGLMLLDLDHFKHVNDTLGHLAGDHLLRVLARRLSGCVSDNGFVARLGGDEFAIVLGGIADDMELVSAATRVLAKIEAPVTFHGKPIGGGMSIGCAMFPRDAADAQGLLKHADMSLYDLKASGRGGIQMFNAELKEAVELTATQLNVARKVIHDDTVEPFYQPKVRLDDGALAGFEALLRWWCPGNGIQLPATVAEAFNDYELSTKIGGLMQTRVFADIAGWLDAGHSLPPVSINASPAEFLRDDYAERLLERIAQFGLSPSLVEVEITEHVFLERRSQQVIRALGLLKDNGIKVALDDFGTGHSSFSHLRDFPVDVLKIDRSFVSRMLAKNSILAIVEAILKLGPSLGLEIVAEGIETPEQLQVLRDAGCAMGQGYLFGKAMDAERAAAWLAEGQWPSVKCLAGQSKVDRRQAA